MGIILGIYSLYISGDVFLDQALVLGSKFGLSSRSTGTYFISFGAVVDEFAVVIASSVRGYGGISFGTIQGSNIITMVIFLAVLPVAFSRNFRKFRIDGFFMLAMTALTLFLALAFNRDPWYAGLSLIAIYALYAIVNRNREPVPPAQETRIEISYASLAASLILLAITSEAIVDYTMKIAVAVHVSSFFSGFIVTGIAGSLPEIVMFILSLPKSDHDSTMGIVSGTVIYKASLILGIAMVFGDMSLVTGLWSIYLMLLLISIFILLSFIRQRKIFSILSLIAVAAVAIWQIFL